MHKALGVVDVFLKVCEEVNKPTSAALARTCKMFHESAIQTLWRTVPGLGPLIMLFPQDAWRVDANAIVNAYGLAVELPRSDSPRSN